MRISTVNQRDLYILIFNKLVYQTQMWKKGCQKKERETKTETESEGEREIKNERGKERQTARGGGRVCVWE